MKPLNKTLIVLIPGFPVNEADTTCLPAQQLLIRKINKLLPSLEIIIIAFQYPFINEEYSWFGNGVIPFNGANKGGISQKILWLKVLRQLHKLKKQKNIMGVFSCWCTECALVGKYFSTRNNLQHYIWICGQDARANNKLVKLIKPDADSLIAISKSVRDEFVKNHKVLPKYIIENGIDTEAYNNKEIEKDIDILGVGSLIPLKQFEILINVVARLKDIRPNIKSVICGDGKEKNKLALMIKNLSLENNIMLTGEISHNEVLLHMQRSKILLHPSSYEGFSGVCIEALYAGAHVISFCDPVEQPVKHWHIVNDIESMYQHSLEILNDVNTDYSPVLVNDMETVQQNLCSYKHRIIIHLYFSAICLAIASNERSFLNWIRTFFFSASMFMCFVFNSALNKASSSPTSYNIPQVSFAVTFLNGAIEVNIGMHPQDIPSQTATPPAS